MREQDFKRSSNINFSKNSFVNDRNIVNVFFRKEFASNSFFSSYVKISDKEGHAVESILTEDCSNQG